MTRAEKYEVIRRLREDEGLLWREIGERLGLSRSTAHEIYSDPTGEKADARRRKRHGFCADCGTTVYNGGSLPPERCRACTDVHVDSRRRRSASAKGQNMRWTDDDICAVLRRLAEDGEPTIIRYRQVYADAPRRSMPSPPIVMRRFGTWNAALVAAGLPVRYPRSGYRGALTRERAALAIEDCAAEIGRPAPSVGAVRVLWGGSWMDAIEACAVAA